MHTRVFVLLFHYQITKNTKIYVKKSKLTYKDFCIQLKKRFTRLYFFKQEL